MAGDVQPAHGSTEQLALQHARVDVLAAKLARAERAVGQARTPAAAADAHRRADALLLELEAAEHVVRRMQADASSPGPAVTQVRRRPQQPTAQGNLFDIA